MIDVTMNGNYSVVDGEWIIPFLNRNENIPYFKKIASNDGYGYLILCITRDNRIKLISYCEGDLKVRDVDIITKEYLSDLILDNLEYYDYIIDVSEVDEILDKIVFNLAKNIVEMKGSKINESISM